MNNFKMLASFVVLLSMAACASGPETTSTIKESANVCAADYAGARPELKFARCGDHWYNVRVTAGEIYRFEFSGDSNPQDDFAEASTAKLSFANNTCRYTFALDNGSTFVLETKDFVSGEASVIENGNSLSIYDCRINP